MAEMRRMAKDRKSWKKWLKEQTEPHSTSYGYGGYEKKKLTIGLNNQASLKFRKIYHTKVIAKFVTYQLTSKDQNSMCRAVVIIICWDFLLSEHVCDDRLV